MIAECANCGRIINCEYCNYIETIKYAKKAGWNTNGWICPECVKNRNMKTHTIWYNELATNPKALFHLFSEIQKGHAEIIHTTSSHVTIKVQICVIDKIRAVIKE